MDLLRLSGDGGVMIFDTGEWTKKEAYEDYMDATGEEASAENESLGFDVLKGEELTRFIQTGKTYA